MERVLIEFGENGRFEIEGNKVYFFYISGEGPPMRAEFRLEDYLRAINNLREEGQIQEISDPKGSTLKMKLEEEGRVFLVFNTPTGTLLKTSKIKDLRVKE